MTEVRDQMSEIRDAWDAEAKEITPDIQHLTSDI
jgi:hypothetical protein